MPPSEIPRHTLSWLGIRQHQGGLSEEERKGITGLADFLIVVEEVELPEPGTPLHSELIADARKGVSDE